MIAIYKREVKSFFHSFIGWLFLAATLLIMSIYFTVTNMLMGYPNISSVLQGASLVFMIAIPIMTMRILAEERKQKTDQLILTAPVSIGKIVLGKYLALITFFAIPIIVIGIAPVILSFYGTFQMGVSYTALLGFFLYVALGLAIGLFLSSLTESVVIAAVSTFVVLFLGYLMPGLCSMISQTGNLLTKILSAFDMYGRFEEMLSGNFYIPSVIYFLSIILLLLYYTKQSIQKRRYSVSGKGLKIGARSSVFIVITAILTIVVNLIINRLPEEMISVDVTSNKLFTVTKETKEFVADLSEDIIIYVLINEEYKDGNFDKMLRKIEDLSEHITVTYIDPAINPRFYSNYADTEPEENSMIVVGPERSKVVGYSSIYEYEYSPYDGQYQVTGYDGEGQIVSALAYVTTDDLPKIYFVAGHDELGMEGMYTQAIQKENIEYEALSLLTVDEIPEDAKAIIINAPINDFSSDEADRVIAYLEEGGNAVIIPTWTEEPLPNFNRILDYYGVSVVDGMIAEEDGRMYYQDPFFLLPQIDYDEITESVYNVAVFAPYSQGLHYDDDREDISYTPLLETSEDAYSKTDLKTAADYEKAEGDIDGPFAIAIKADKSMNDGMVSRAVIVATENIFTENADYIVPGNNVKLFSGIISNLVEHESSVLVPVKYYDAGILAFSTMTCVVVGILSILVMPISALVTGFVIWFHRRKR